MRRCPCFVIWMGLSGLSGCGGGGDPGSAGSSLPPSETTTPPPSTVRACLKGITVAGLPYFTDVEQGVTDAAGCFSFTPNHPVTFFVGTRSGTDVHGNVLGVANVAGGQEISVAAFSREATTQENIERFLLVVRSSDDLSNGIVLAPEVLTQVATLPQLDFSHDISDGLAQLQVLALQSGDGGHHLLVDSVFARGVIDAGVRCGYTGTYAWYGTGRSASATKDDIGVKTKFWVYPPDARMAGTISFSPIDSNYAVTTAVVPFYIDQPLSVTAPRMDLSVPGLTLSAALSDGVFSGSGTSQAPNLAATFTFFSFNATANLGSNQRYVGQGLFDMVLEVAAGGKFWGLISGLPQAKGSIVAGSFNDDGSVTMFDPYNEVVFSAKFTGPLQLSVEAYAPGPFITSASATLFGCIR